MATESKRISGDKTHSDGHDGLAKWVLGAVGLVWIFRLATRASRRHGNEALRQNQPHLSSSLAATGAPSFSTSHPVRGHEQRDANAKWIFGIVLFMFVSGLSIHGIMAGYLGALKRTAPPTDHWRPDVPSSANSAPPPRLQVSAPAELHAFRAREEAELHSYGWVDRRAGTVRIPIEQAMDAVLREGLPTRTGTNQSQTGPSAYDLVRQRSEQQQPQTQGEQ